MCSYSRYDYETTEEVEKHLGRDFKRMIFCIEEYGYVCQDQFEELSDYLCESCAYLIVKSLSKATDKSVFYAYSQSSNSYVFYDTERLDLEEAKKQSDKIQSFLYEE